MKESNTNAGNATIKQREVLLDTKGLTWRSQVPSRAVQLSSDIKRTFCSTHDEVKELWSQYNHNTTTMGSLAEYKRAVNEGVKYQCGKCNHQATTKGSLAGHKRAYMEESSTLAGSATIKRHQKDVLLSTKGQYM